MHCKDFREISEAYLNDELLVETNLQVFKHLEHCADCRHDFAARKALRQHLRSAVLRADESAIDPAFATRVRAELRSAAVDERGWFALLRSGWALVPAMSLLLVVAMAAFVFLRESPTDGIVATSPSALQTFLAEVSVKAAGSHDDCALEKMARWESGVPIKADAEVIAASVTRPLVESFDGGVDVLHSHDCLFDGKRFSHVIVRNKGDVISVFFDRSGAPAGTASTDSIVSEQERGHQVASFFSGPNAVFVVSDLPEPENVQAARTLLNSFSSS